MPDELIPIKTFPNTADAEIARGFLESNGIYAAVPLSDTSGLETVMGFHGIELLVRPEDADEARTLLESPESPGDE